MVWTNQRREKTGQISQSCLLILLYSNMRAWNLFLARIVLYVWAQLSTREYIREYAWNESCTGLYDRHVSVLLQKSAWWEVVVLATLQWRNLNYNVDEEKGRKKNKQQKHNPLIKSTSRQEKRGIQKWIWRGFKQENRLIWHGSIGGWGVTLWIDGIWLTVVALS